MNWILVAISATFVVVLSIWAVCHYIENRWLYDGLRDDEMDDWDSWKPELKMPENAKPDMFQVINSAGDILYSSGPKPDGSPAGQEE
jgi:hypothetical protein